MATPNCLFPDEGHFQPYSTLNACSQIEFIGTDRDGSLTGGRSIRGEGDRATVGGEGFEGLTDAVGVVAEVFGPK